MSLETLCIKRIKNNEGFGLIAAIFVITILATFGLLVARFSGTGNVESAEDYLWAQALYSSQSGISLRILQHDGGGNFGAFSYPAIAQFTLQEITPPTVQNPQNQPSVVRVTATRTTVSRTLEAKYVL